MNAVTVAPGIVLIAALAFIVLSIGIILISLKAIQKPLNIPELVDVKEEVETSKPEKLFDYKLDNMILRMELSEGVWKVFLKVGAILTDTGITSTKLSIAMLRSFQMLKVSQKQSCFRIPELLEIE